MDLDAMVRGEAGARLIDRLRTSGFPVTVAFWAKPIEDATWSLYVASPEVASKGAAAAYRAIHAVLRAMPELGIDYFDVQALDDHDPMAEAAAALIRPKTPPGPSAATNPKPYPGMTHFRGSSLGGTQIDGAAVYPADLSALLQPAAWGG